ncbi:ATP-dependent nuclease [Argonema galeatum]|uniref:ATP-dependent nuclease n=1 Tax=Argonema galeatum TaxID=2942762 RepID=UPI00201335F5|nr:AAA family ATPase [Argonema galeatum]MCL1468271.1 AAA family ATPase [Argonema galeatum A003/A1]
MYISKIQVLNYKSFLDSGQLEFNPGMNIIVGQNNAGKTALLEALTLNFSNVPNRSMKTLPLPSSKLEEKSRVEVTLNFTKHEFINFLDELNPNSIGITSQKKDASTKNQLVNCFQEWLKSAEFGEFTFSLSGEGLIKGSIPIKGLIPPFNLLHIIESREGFNESQMVYLKKGNDNCLVIDIEKINHSPAKTASLSAIFLNFLTKRIYRLNAERSNLGSCSFGDNSQLKPDASNLAEVLNILQLRGTQKTFNLYNSYVSTIFPNIKEIAPKPKKSRVEIRVWSKEAADNDREDLSLPLSACGTGIGQVLAILYVVITSPEPRTIIIDEPQSFLHPGAAKKLIEILKQFPQHQYFIATHSPQIVSAANPSTIMQLRYKDNETKAESINSLNTVQMRSLLSDVGVSLSDVFGADNILWVEGATEELCFPMILEKVAKQPLKGTKIVGIKNTGDLEGKHAATIFEIYRRLSGGNTLFPPAIGFLLDSETKNDKQKEDLRRAANNLEKDVEQQTQVPAKKEIPVKFLARRMYENYLLHPKAIASVLNNIFNEYKDLGGKNVTDVDIEEFIEQKTTNGDDGPKGTNKEALSRTEWVVNVHGAKILKALFEQFAGTLVRFDKTKHSPLITEWLLENEPQHLVELAKLLEDMLNYNTQDK